MGILQWLQGREPSPPKTAGTGDTDTVRKIVSELEAMPPDRARFIAAFAYILGRVAHADHHFSDEETDAMESVGRRFGELPEEQAVLVVQIAKSQNRLFGGTENFLVTREFRRISDSDERRHLLDCMFAVSAADESISSAEESQIRQIASELGFTHRQFVEARLAWSDQREVLRPFREET
jgi:uncharacterized tellurite resistance protein B-like protein